ncbi:MAG: HEPN domain-containing protein [Nitrosomonas sp.]|nr:HEPN domain-containing protein [Nitrosomonas sp.]
MIKNCENATPDDSLSKLPENFAFVMNVKEFLSPVPYEMTTDHLFRRATSNEIEIIDNTVKEMSASPHKHTLKRFWKRRLPGPPYIKDDLLPEEEWRYYVITFNGENSHLMQYIQAASDISPKEIEIGFNITFHMSGEKICHSYGSIPSRYYQTLQRIDRDPDYFINIKQDDISYISSKYSQIIKHDPSSYPSAFDVKDVTLLDINNLKSLPYRSRFQFLGYFAILESLLVHKPKSTDPYDTITRQVKKKLVLLDNIWTPRLDYTFSPTSSTEKIWGKMYELRSQIAHGDSIKSYDYGCLKEYSFAFSLLEQTVKSILRFTLDNTRLIVDLREC